MTVLLKKQKVPVTGKDVKYGDNSALKHPVRNGKVCVCGQWTFSKSQTNGEDDFDCPKCGAFYSI